MKNHKLNAFMAILATASSIASTAALAQVNESLQSRKEMTSAEAFEIAMREGKSRGILVGAEAAALKAQSHSNDLTLVDVVKGESLADGCQIMYMTLNQPNVPTTTGANAGNYVAKTKFTLCRDGRSPLVEVVGCSVGMRSCMPPK
jgi:hypothetical protein